MSVHFFLVYVVLNYTLWAQLYCPHSNSFTASERDSTTMQTLHKRLLFVSRLRMRFLEKNVTLEVFGRKKLPPTQKAVWCLCIVGLTNHLFIYVFATFLMSRCNMTGEKCVVESLFLQNRYVLEDIHLIGTISFQHTKSNDLCLTCLR